MADLFHSVSLPASPAAPRALAWPAQDPASIRTLALDCTRWLDAAGRTIVRALVQTDPALSAGGVACDGKVVRLVLTGGLAGTVPAVSIVLVLDNGDRENVMVSAPIRALSPPVPAGAVAASEQIPGTPATPADTVGVPLVTGAAVGGHRVLMFDGQGRAVHAQPSWPGYVFAGLSLGAAAAGAPVQALEGGAVTEVSWSWTPGAALFAGPAGVLTPVPPTAGILQQVAVALSATSIRVQAYVPILLAS